MDLSKLRTISDADVSGKRVLVRADLNVPVADGKVTDATRLERILAGLKDLSARNARVVVISHFGRPKGGPDPSMSLAPVAAKLGELLGKPVTFVDDLHRRAAPRMPSRASRRAKSPCSKTFASTRARRRTTRSSSPRSPAPATCSSTTPSRRRIARTPRPKVSRACCRPTPVR